MVNRPAAHSRQLTQPGRVAAGSPDSAAPLPRSGGHRHLAGPPPPGVCQAESRRAATGRRAISSASSWKSPGGDPGVCGLPRRSGCCCPTRRGHGHAGARGKAPDDKPVVHWLGVLPSFRRTGIGRLLLAALEAAVWDAGGRQVWLETHGGWAEAARLYTRLRLQAGRSVAGRFQQRRLHADAAPLDHHLAAAQQIAAPRDRLRIRRRTRARPACRACRRPAPARPVAG